MTGGDDDVGGPGDPRENEPDENLPPDEHDFDGDPDADLDETAASAEAEDERPWGRRRRLERLLPDVLKRAIEKGIETGLGTLTNTSESLRGVAQKTNEAAQGLPKELGSVPKEFAGFVFSQIDDTKNAMVRVVAREVREFLEKADIAKELHRALTSLSFEIKTEIRFIPNEAGGIKPEVRAAAAGKRLRRAARRPSAVAAERAARGREGEDELDE